MNERIEEMGVGVQITRMVNGKPTVIKDRAMMRRVEALAAQNVERLTALRNQYRKSGRGDMAEACDRILANIEAGAINWT